MGSCLSKPDEVVECNASLCQSLSTSTQAPSKNNGTTPASAHPTPPHHTTHQAAAKDDGFRDAHPTLSRVSSANSYASDLFVDAQEDPVLIPPAFEPTAPTTTMQDVMRAVAMGQANTALGTSMQQSKSTTLSKVNLIAPSDSDEWLNDLLGGSPPVCWWLLHAV